MKSPKGISYLLHRACRPVRPVGPSVVASVWSRDADVRVPSPVEPADQPFAAVRVPVAVTLSHPAAPAVRVFSITLGRGPCPVSDTYRHSINTFIPYANINEHF